jgi:hypothetical protein
MADGNRNISGDSASVKAAKGARLWTEHRGRAVETALAAC